MSRTATVTRKTRETNITVTLDLDGSGKADLHTGIGFFDHMLDGFARHGLFDLTLHCDGDLNVDCHHTIEDCGIALGTAIREALGDKAGIVRYGSSMLPMDETLALCAVDLGGRPYFVYDASFAGQSFLSARNTRSRKSASNLNAIKWLHACSAYRKNPRRRAKTRTEIKTVVRVKGTSNRRAASTPYPPKMVIKAAHKCPTSPIKTASDI